eukprot:GFYU01001507.1.p1 GENE.GFYU01001507.1~~GFYU01001507.1.p1  ORF type:complete len:212 (-),score=54.18 GFYU01001507.1:113-748(-)
MLKNAATSAAKGAAASALNGANPNKPKINWENYNYPPYLRLVHVDFTELQGEAQRTAVFVHRAYILMMSTLGLNFFTSFVLACAGIADQGLAVMYSIFNIIIGGVVGMYSFYRCYVGICNNTDRDLWFWLIPWAILTIFMWIFSGINGLNMHGWANIADAKAVDGGISDFWVAMAVIESLLWTGGAIYSMFCIYMVWMFKEKGGVFLSSRV